MAGDASRTKRRLKRATAAVLTAGAVAAAPWPLTVHAAPGDPIDIRRGANDGFTRLEFGGPIGARARVRRDGDDVVVRVGSTAAPDIALIRIDPPPGVTEVETRAVSGATEIVLTLAEGADARFGNADGAVYLNIFPATAAGERARGPSETVAVQATVEADSLQLDFDWGRPVPAAVFRRGEAVWVVFDASARLDMREPPSGLGPADNVRWVRGEDFTAIRIEAPGDQQPWARADGGRWIVGLGGPASPPDFPVEVRRDDDSGPPALAAAVPGATRVLWIQDPTVGDRIGVVTAAGPAKGLEAERRLIDVTLLPTAQGLALTPAVDDLAVTVVGDMVRISRPAGLLMSAPTDGLQQASVEDHAPRAAPFPAQILAQWADTGEDGFFNRYRSLQAAAAEEGGQGDDAPVEARMGLARFLVGSGLHYEAIGVLNELIRTNGAMGSDAELRGLRGVARAAIGRLAEAQADFASGPLTDDPSAALWRGYIAARQNQWEEARRNFAEGRAAVDGFPPEWRARFATAHAEASLGMADLDTARVLIAYALQQDLDPRGRMAVRMVQARLFEQAGDVQRGAAIYEAISRSPYEDQAVPASLHAARLELAGGQLTPSQAIERMEPLRWRWRGDASELQVIRTLGGVYLGQGRYREALEVLRGAGDRLPNLPQSAELQADLSNAFRALFLDGAADGLQPIQAVALFEDFRDLTPPGAEGDDMVRRLARRLVELDLLDRAAALLEYQVTERLDGVAAAHVATDAAAIRLMNREPQKALEDIWSTRTTLLPTQLQTERRAVEARALLMLGRYDHALEVIGNDTTPEGQAVRADIYWRQQRWMDAAALYDAGLGARYSDTARRLTPDEENRVIRAGIGYSIAENDASLARLAERYDSFIGGARNPDAMRLALARSDQLGTLRDAQAMAQRIDTFAGWVSRVRARFREETQADDAQRQQGAGGAAAPQTA